MRVDFHASSASERRRLRRLSAALFAFAIAGASAPSSAQTSTAAPELEDLTGGLPPLLELPTASIDDDDLEVQVFGFADFSYFHAFLDNTNYLAAVIPEHASFYVGNINTYLRTTFDRFTSLVEIRFLYQPHGSFDPFSPNNQVSTNIVDSADPSAQLNWGGVEIERAWLEIEFDSRLQLRVGQWLTPYGIWNVDHGTPIIVAVRRPYTIGQEYMPERQSGIQLRGVLESGAHVVGYHLTLSNGRGGIDAIADLDENKAIGARVYYQLVSDISLQVGLSGYAGRFTAANTQIDIVDGNPSFTRAITKQYDELIGAADLKLEYKGLLLQSEFVINRRRFTEGGRSELLVGGGLTPDHYVWGFYTLAGYRTPWWGLMPYVMVEHSRQPIDLIDLDKVLAFYFGLNWRLHPRVTVKAEGAMVRFVGDYKLAEGTTWVFQSQIAWAF